MIKLSTLNEETLKIDEIKQLFVTTLNSHAPMKATNFVTKELQKQPPRGALKKRCSENAANLQENTHAKVRFQ